MKLDELIKRLGQIYLEEGNLTVGVQGIEDSYYHYVVKHIIVSNSSQNIERYVFIDYKEND